MADEVFELRRYTLKPGRRDDLIELFDREFVESQDAVGAHVVGQFRDLDDPDQFVWLRSFADMRTRLDALTTFYGGAVWKRHSAAAKATMLAVDNVLLLRPIVAPSTVPGSRDRPKRGEVTALIWTLDAPVTEHDVEWLRGAATGTLRAAHTVPLALFATLYEHNDFPGLPVRAGHRLVALAQHAHDRLADLTWPVAPEVVRLAPTGRSHTFAEPAQ